MKKIIAIIGFIGAVAGNVAFAGYFNDAPLYTCDVAITRTLQVGSENNEVFVLQEFLARAGYLQASPNGHFGQATKQAVRSFQYENDIPATGSVGEATRNALNERLCDADVRVNTYYNDYYGNDYYGYNSGVTYVDDYDPYVMVMLPKPTLPSVYQTPQNRQAPLPMYAVETGEVRVSPIETPSVTAYTVPLPTVPATVPAQTSNQIASSQIVYNPFVGYTYSITPRTGTLTITSPAPNTMFREGDTVNVRWTISNIDANGYQVILENSSGGQSRVLAHSKTNSASFVLTREVLDTVCSGNCISYGKNSYKIIIATPLTDIAGQTATFRASVSPISIERPFGMGTVSITTSQSPTVSGEGFRLYVNVPSGASWDANLYGQYSFKIRAVCPSGVSVSIAGTPCGQDFVLPFTPSRLQESIPTMMTNSTWFSKHVTFELVVTNPLGQIIGTSQVNVVVNGQPFNW